MLKVNAEIAKEKPIYPIFLGDAEPGVYENAEYNVIVIKVSAEGLRVIMFYKNDSAGSTYSYVFNQLNTADRRGNYCFWVRPLEGKLIFSNGN